LKTAACFEEMPEDSKPARVADRGKSNHKCSRMDLEGEDLMSVPEAESRKRAHFLRMFWAPAGAALLALLTFLKKRDEEK
jgi:hypothetical protein